MQHILNHSDTPLDVHCTASKDRTGIFADLVLSLCGVSEEDIVTDYAYTTRGLGKWREHLIKRLMKGDGNDYRDGGDGDGDAEVTKPPTSENVVASRSEQMRGFLEQVLQRRFGGARAFCREHCGFSDRDLDTIVDNLTHEHS